MKRIRNGSYDVGRVLSNGSLWVDRSRLRVVHRPGSGRHSRSLGFPGLRSVTSATSRSHHPRQRSRSLPLIPFGTRQVHQRSPRVQGAANNHRAAAPAGNGAGHAGRQRQPPLRAHPHGAQPQRNPGDNARARAHTFAGQRTHLDRRTVPAQNTDSTGCVIS